MFKSKNEISSFFMTTWLHALSVKRRVLNVILLLQPSGSLLRKLVTIAIVGFLFAAKAIAQTSAVDYTLVRTSGTYTNIESASGVTTYSDISCDDCEMYTVPIGFNFTTGGVTQTYINTISSNGYFMIGGMTCTIAYTDLFGNICYSLTTGTAPNRVFTFQFGTPSSPFGMFGGPGNCTFQLKLYETSNIIEYVYGSPQYPSDREYAIGIAWSGNQYLETVSGSTTVGDFHYVNGTPDPGSILTWTPGVSCSTPAAIGGPSAVCVGSTITLTNDTTGGSWSSADASIASVNTSGVVTGNEAGATTISYSTGTGCMVTKTITVNGLPSNTIASFTPQPTIAGLPVSFTVSNTSLPSYSWNFGDATSSTIMHPTKSYATSGTFIPTLTVTNSNGCSSSDTAIVVISPMPPITGYTPPLCTADAPDTLRISVSGGTWSSSNTATATIGSATGILSAVSPGSATITYHFGSGIFTTTTITAGNSPNPILGPSTTCMGANNGLYVTPYGSAGAWTSSNTAVATIGTGTGICSAVSLGTTTIKWTVPSGCYVTRTQTVVPSPAAITGPSFLCSGDTVTYMNDTSGGTWTSTNSGVVSVNSATGLATGVAAGTSTLSYTIAYGCASTKLLNGGALPAAIVGGLVLCPSGTSTLSCTTAGGAWTSGTTGVATVSGGVVTAVSTGTASITYTIPSGCRRSVIVTVNAAPGANTGTAELCVGGSTTLSNATTGGTWSSGSTAVATVGSSTGVVTGVSTGNANITYRVSGAGCYSARTVTVNSITGAISGTLNACVGETSILSHSTTGGTWSSSNTSIATVGASSGAVLGVSTGTATITYYITSSCYITTSFTVKALPTAISGTQTVCVGSTTTLTSGPTGGTWISSGAITAVVNATTGLVSGVSAGTATISYSLSNGCRRTAVVTVNEVPASITGPTGVCIGSTGALANATSGGTWSSSNTTVATIGGTTGVVSGLLTGTTSITYTLSTGCRATRVTSVVTAPAAISGTATLCAGSVTTLSSTTAGGTWSSSNNSVATTGTATGTSTVVSGVSTGVATISYIVGGCSTTREVTVNASPGAISGLNPICVGNTGTYSIGGTGGTWVSSSSFVTIGSATGVATAVTAGTARISYRVSTTCYSTLPVTVTATPASISGTAKVCIGYTTVLGHPVSGGTWSGSSSAASVTDSAGFGVVAGSISGTGTITYTLPSGCYRTVVVTVNSNPGVPSGGTSPICAGATTNLTSSPAGGTWLSSTTTVGTVGATTGVVMGVSAGTTTISYLISATGCFSTKEVTVNPLPGMIAGSSTVCVGATTTLSDTTGGGGLWTMTPTTVATIGGSTGTVTGVIAGAATVSYTLSTGCRRTRAMTVLASPAVITGNLTLCVGNTTTLGSSPAGLTWSSSAAAVAPVSTGGVVSGYATGIATISYTNASGCSRTAVVTVNAALPANTSSSGAMGVCVGTTITLSNTVSGGTWSSASSAIASAGSTTGVVGGVSIGSTNVTYSFGTGCRSISTITVNAVPAAITGAAIITVGSSATLACVTTGGNWSSSNTALGTVGSISGVVTGISSGTITISYTIPSGCRSLKQMTVNPAPLARQAYATEDVITGSISMYPNPTTGNLTISSSISGELSIYTIEGKVAGQYSITTGTNTIQFSSDLAAGVYICRFTGIDGSTQQVRMVLLR